MTGIPDELATTAANEVFSLSLEQTLNLHIEDCEAITDVVLDAVGLPALLERVEAAERDKNAAVGRCRIAFARSDALAAKVEVIPLSVERRIRAESWDEGWRVGASGRNMPNPYRAALTEGTEGG